MEIENESPVTAKPLPQNIWMHGLTMLILLALTHLALALLGACGVIQFFWMLVSKERNEQIVTFGKGLANWLNMAAGFVTGKSEDKPFPWTQWTS
jgi:Domain of unknown function (DUF4389)